MGASCSRRATSRALGTTPIHNWMPNFLGVSEQELLNSDRAQYLVDGGFVDKQSGRIWPAGSFQCLSIAELVKRVADLPSSNLTTTPALTVVDGIDIGRLQATLKTDDYAMVQIASNFNCLEVPNRKKAPDCGRLVEGYASDATQGPAASFGVPAACLLRTHYPFKDTSKPSDVWGQTLDRQIELLADVRKYFGTCINGKISLDGSEEELMPADIDDTVNQIKVGIHSDAQVVYGRSSWTAMEIVSEPQPYVDQLLSAAVCLPDPGQSKSPQQLSCLTRAALRACYQGTYLAAILRQRRLLLLTLVGGGVFGNPEDVILQEIAIAHAQWAKHPASRLMEVRLCLYPPGSAARTEKALQQLLSSS